MKNITKTEVLKHLKRLKSDNKEMLQMWKEQAKINHFYESEVEECERIDKIFRITIESVNFSLRKIITK